MKILLQLFHYTVSTKHYHIVWQREKEMTPTCCLPPLPSRAKTQNMQLKFYTIDRPNGTHDSASGNKAREHFGIQLGYADQDLCKMRYPKTNAIKIL